MKLEVRCCCEPKKLRGWITANDSRREHTFALRPELVSGVALLAPPRSPETVTMRIELINPGNGSREYLAFKAEGIPLEKLRRIYGFEEAETT